MAAGLGFKTFTTGEVLTAGDVNGYLMQGVLVFASAAARNAAITSPQEGQFAFTKDTNGLWYYDGAAWVASGATGDIEGVSVTSPITGGGTSGTVTIGIDSTAVVPSQTGNSGKYLTTNGTVSSWGTVSGGGTTWTNRQAGGTGPYVITQIEYNGSNLYVAIGEAASLFTSPDGITWTSRTSGFGANDIYGVGYGNGLWVIVGQSGLLSTSTDGITWTARTAGVATNQINKVMYANSIWVAVGAGGGTNNTGGLIYSTDGITWTRKSQSIATSDNYNCLAWNGTYWLIGAGNVTFNAIYATTPSGTWTGVLFGAFEIGQMEVSGTTIWFSSASSTSALYQVTSVTGGTATSISALGSALSASGVSKTWRIYNNRIYVFGTVYWSSFSTTLVNNYANPEPYAIHGTAFSSTGSALSGGQVACYVNATGIIIGSSYSRISTSF